MLGIADSEGHITLHELEKQEVGTSYKVMSTGLTTAWIRTKDGSKSYNPYLAHRIMSFAYPWIGLTGEIPRR